MRKSYRTHRNMTGKNKDLITVLKLTRVGRKNILRR